MKLKCCLCIVAACGILLTCKAQPEQRPAPAKHETSQGVTPVATKSARPSQLDAQRIAAITGAKPETSDGVVKVSFPRDDVRVNVDGWKMPPFMGLTSWAGFVPGEKSGIEAMIMGDIVLFEDEVSAVMSTALDSGLEVTALHNHFFFDQPKVYFMHIGGEGALDALARGVRAMQDATKKVRAANAAPARQFQYPAMPAKSVIELAAVEAALGRKGSAKDGMVKIVVGRPAAVADCGCKIGKTMGVNTWAAFAGTNDNAVVDGDFAVEEAELQSVLKALRHGNINVVAIHHHMVGEKPRILFLHYWGRGKVAELGATLKAALALTKTEQNF